MCLFIKTSLIYITQLECTIAKHDFSPNPPTKIVVLSLFLSLFLSLGKDLSERRTLEKEAVDKPLRKTPRIPPRRFFFTPKDISPRGYMSQINHRDSDLYKTQHDWQDPNI